MNEPIQWEKVPVTGFDLGQQVYRARIEDIGWVVITMSEARGVLTTSTFVPDPNMGWGKEPEQVKKKGRWD